MFDSGLGELGGEVGVVADDFDPFFSSLEGESAADAAESYDADAHGVQYGVCRIRSIRMCSMFWNRARSMEAGRFWEIIDSCREGQLSANEERLKEKLEGLSVQDVKAFLSRFEKEHLALNRWSVWGAGFVICEYMGDDSFQYFKCWLIGRGAEVVELAKKSPDDLGEFVPEGDLLDNEGLLYAIFDVLEEKAVDPESLRRNLDVRPRGLDWRPNELPVLYPKLTKRFR